MAKIKSMGIEYKIIAEGNWEDIANLAKLTKKAIEDTQKRPIYLFRKESDMEDKILEAILLPNEGEKFSNYRSRVVASGVISTMERLTSPKTVPYSFNFIINDGESSFLVDSKIRENKYEVKISASGEYSQRGVSIARELKETLEKRSLKHSYDSLEKMI